MWIFIYMLLAIGVLWALKVANLRKIDVRKARESFVAAHPDWYIDISPFDSSLIGIREDGNALMFGSQGKPVIVPVHDLFAVAVLQDDVPVEAPLFAGGQRISSLAIKVMLGATPDHVHVVTFLNSPGRAIPANTPLAKQSIEKLTYWHSVLLGRLAKLKPE